MGVVIVVIIIVIVIVVMKKTGKDEIIFIAVFGLFCLIIKKINDQTINDKMDDDERQI